MGLDIVNTVSGIFVSVAPGIWATEANSPNLIWPSVPSLDFLFAMQIETSTGIRNPWVFHSADYVLSRDLGAYGESPDRTARIRVDGSLQVNVGRNANNEILASTDGAAMLPSLIVTIGVLYSSISVQDLSAIFLQHLQGRQAGQYWPVIVKER